jgi:hypothetical protein
LRDLFNGGTYWERAQAGEFSERVQRSDEISPRKRRKLSMPHGSLSQIVAYCLPDGTQVALVHQYVRPDGRVRGKPDPKYLLIDGEIHAPHPEPPECPKERPASTERGHA